MWKRFNNNAGTRAARHGLSASDALQATTLATLSDQVAIIDQDGSVIATNQAWKTFDCQCRNSGLQSVEIGANYLEACQVAEEAGVGGAEGAILGLRAVLDGSRPHFALTHQCQSSSGLQWFRMTATTVGSPGDGALISHTNVAEPSPAGEAPPVVIAEQQAGEPLLRVLTENLADTIGARFAFLSEVVDQASGKVRIIALWDGEGFGESFEYDVADTPCQDVLRGDLCAYPVNVQKSFPDDVWLWEIAAESYVAAPLFSAAGEVIGHIGVIHDQRLDDILLAEYVVRTIAAPAGVELERSRLVRSLLLSDATARALLNAAVDTAILMEPDGTITDLNEVAATRLGTTVEEAVGKNAFEFFPADVAATRRAALEKVIATRKPLQFTDERAGMHFDHSFYPVLGPDGAVVKVTVFASNVTERKLADDQLRKSEQHHRTLVETITHGIEEIDLSGVITFANKAYHQIYGYDDGELIGTSVLDLSPSEHERDALRSYLALVAKDTPTPVPMTAKKKTKSGRIIDVELAWAYRRDGDGQVAGLIGVVTDVTARMRAEAALAQNERRMRLVTEHISEMIWLSDPGNHKLLYVSQAYERIWGRTCQSLYDNPQSWLEAVHPDDKDRVRAASGKATEVFDEEYRVVHTDGSLRWVWDRSFPIHEKPDGRTRKAGITVDITERKLVEERIRRSEQRQRLLVETMTHGVEEIDTSGVITFANAAHRKQYGYSEGELLGKSILDLVASDADRESLRDYLQYLIKEQPSPTPYVGQKLTKGGSVIDVEVDWDYLRGEEGQLSGFVSVVTDVTEKKKTQDDLSLQAKVLENMAEGVNVCDMNARILITNSAFDAMFGYERGELIDQHVSVLNADPPEENARIIADVQTTLEQSGSWRGEFNNVRKDGTLFTTSANITVLEMSGKTCVISVQEDITERKRAEEAARETARRNENLLQSIPDMMFTLDRQGVYVDFVPADNVEPLVPTEEFIGKTVFEVLPLSLAQDIKQKVELALTTGNQHQLDYELQLDDGPHNYEARILKSKEDEALAIVRDVTALRRQERETERRRVRDELEGKVEREMLGKNPYGLTFREFTVLHLAANGEADKEIAEGLGISTFTVSKHVANILGKMAASSRTEACVRALREGLLT